jgi:Fe2+ transport system protein FeoA
MDLFQILGCSCHPGGLGMLTLLLPVPRLVAPQRDTNLWFSMTWRWRIRYVLTFVGFPASDGSKLRLLELSVVRPFHIKKVKKVPFKSPVKIEIRGKFIIHVNWDLPQIELESEE